MTHDGILCPICGGDTHVSETRSNVGSMRRRRRCLRDRCDGRLTTVEVAAPRMGGEHGKHTAAARDIEIVPRRMMQALREILMSTDTGVAAPEEHW